jgi:hypothetical protein
MRGRLAQQHWSCQAFCLGRACVRGRPMRGCGTQATPRVYDADPTSINVDKASGRALVDRADRRASASVKLSPTARPVAGAAVAIVVLGAFASSALAAAQPPPGSRLLHYLWAYNDGQLRPYVAAVSLRGGRVVVANGRSSLTGATANVHETLHDQSSFAKASRFMCQVAAGGVQKLHLAMVATVQVWSIEGHIVARC